VPDIVAGAQKAIGLGKFLDLGGKIGIGLIIGLLFSQFVCGTKNGAIEHIYHSDTLYTQPVHDTLTEVKWRTVAANNMHGIARDSSDCSVFDILQYPIEGDTISLIGIDCQNQSIALAFFSTKDTIIRIHTKDTTIVHEKDSVIIHEVSKVKGLGYNAGAFVSTERFGAVIDGYYDNYHLFFAPRLRYLDAGSLWNKLGFEAGLQINFLP